MLYQGLSFGETKMKNHVFHCLFQWNIRDSEIGNKSFLFYSILINEIYLKCLQFPQKTVLNKLLATILFP